MKTYPCSIPRKRLAVRMAALFFLALSAPGAGAQEPQSPDPAKAEKIRIRSESLEVDNTARTAEFAGNVKATQGDTVIQADRLRIHYKPAAGGNGGGRASGEDVIERIVAEGKVSIQFDDKVARTDRAVYTTQDRVLVLSGAGSTVTSGRNAISGSRISVERETGRIRVEGGEESAVEAVFFPGDQGLN